MACGSESTAQDRQPDGAGASDGINLFAYIDRDRVWGLNVEPPEAAKDAIKPWDQRHSLDTYTESSVDDQLIITIPFICPVRVQSILLHVGRGDLAPTVRSLCMLTQRCVAYVNLPDGLDFEHAAMADGRVGPPASGRPQADFALLPGATDVTTYPVSVLRFSHTTSMSLLLVCPPFVLSTDKVRLGDATADARVLYRFYRHAVGPAA